MTISSENRKAGPFTGNDVTTIFPFTFKIFNATDVMVVMLDINTGIETTLLLNTNYTVQMNVDQNTSPGGTITMVVALPSTQKITITTALQYLQGVAITNHGGFYPDVINNALDRLTIFVQQEAERVSRSLKTSISTPPGFNATLPAPVPYQLIGWNSTGDGFQNTDPTYSTALATDLASAQNWKGVSLVAGAARMVDTIVELKALPKTSNSYASLLGYYSKGDGGGGYYWFDSSDTTSADNGGTIIVATDGGRWKRVENKILNVKQFGAKGDGATNDRAFFANADALGYDIFVPPGNYVIATSITLVNRITFAKGAMLSIPTGVTVTFSNGINAGINQIFSIAGTGAVVFNKAKQQFGYPEWWGATTGGADCLSAISACFVACPITQLQAGDYFLSNVLKLNTPGRTLIGSTPFYNGVAGDSTRIIAPDGSATCIQIGPDAQPGTINEFTQGISVINIEVSRGAAPVIASNCVGLRVQFVLYNRLINVKSVESMRGFEFIGAVGSHYDDLWAARSIAGTGGGTDYWYGLYINGNTTIPASGGNASIYFNRPNASLSGGGGTNSNGIYIDGNWADTFITDAEVNGCSTGISCQGNGSATFGYGETDLQINNPVIDTYTFAGIHINNLSKYGCISINSGMAAPKSGSSPTASIYVNASLGPISINNFQHILGPVPSITGGLVCVNSNSIESVGNIYLECGSIPVILNTCDNCAIFDRVSNNNNTVTSAAQLTASTSCKIEMSINGAANKVGIGYQLISTANNRNELNCTGINSGCINGGSANKLQINSVQITTTGLSGTNLVSGVMT